MPAITAIGDACWSKRSYNFNYNANSSAGVLIGGFTSKILYLGIKNKYCSVCQSEDNKDHKCFKNWKASSTSMEQAIIVDGFKKL